MEHTLGLFAYPILVSGDYSPYLRNMVEKNLSLAGSIIPLFTDVEKLEIKGNDLYLDNDYDFQCYIHYTLSRLKYCFSMNF